MLEMVDEVHGGEIDRAELDRFFDKGLPIYVELFTDPLRARRVLTDLVTRIGECNGIRWAPKI